MRNITEVEIPVRLAARPRDDRGFPIPCSVLQPEGAKPDFRITDIAAWTRAVKLRRCALCGEPLGRHLAFVGGPLSHETRLFTDLPMHRDCADYALRVCPFLAAPNYRYAETVQRPEGHSISVTETVSSVRPDRFFLGMTTDYAVAQGSDGSLYVRANPWREVVWWRFGAPEAGPGTSE